jgi:hypothetical protein
MISRHCRSELGAALLDLLLGCTVGDGDDTLKAALHRRDRVEFALGDDQWHVRQCRIGDHVGIPQALDRARILVESLVARERAVFVIDDPIGEAIRDQNPITTTLAVVRLDADLRGDLGIDPSGLEQLNRFLVQHGYYLAIHSDGSSR